MARLCSSLLLSLLIASSASAVTMDWTPIGNPGNACDPQSQGCFGAVGYEYYIGTYEVTNAQYAEFLNAKAAVGDPFGLYHPTMGDTQSFGGIRQTGSLGNYSYSAITGRENMPANYVDFYDALRFANWMSNGQGNGKTETGSYTLLGETPTPSNGTTVTRNATATIVLTSEDEWYKAAYYDPRSSSYFDYPTGTDTQTVCSAPTGTANHANCARASFGDLTVKGSYTGSASPYGTFDQGGNVREWNETIIGSASARGSRGGSLGFSADLIAASFRSSVGPSGASAVHGFRLAMIPEPGTGLLVVVGLLGLARWRRERA